MWIQYVNILRYPEELGISCLFLNGSENHCINVWLQNPLWGSCQKDANRNIPKNKVQGKTTGKIPVQLLLMPLSFLNMYHIA